MITTNCAVLGVVLLNVQNDYNFIGSVVYGITGGLGFLLAIYLFSTVRERLEFADYPKACLLYTSQPDDELDRSERQGCALRRRRRGDRCDPACHDEGRRVRGADRAVQPLSLIHI